MAIILTPVIIIAEKRIEKYVGHDTAKKMKKGSNGAGAGCISKYSNGRMK
jgi:hypothetical protein